VKTTHPWHFPRYALAERYLQTLKTGPQSLAIFAERRKGKTEFLNYDLTPIALKQRYRCTYINFWEDRTNPVTCVVNGIDRSLRSELTGRLKGWKKEVSLKLGALQAKLTKEPELSPSSANAAFDCLMQPKGAVLLMCDEVQHLATNPAFEDFTASLRTFIDSNKARIRVVFTGSSQDNLNRLFKSQRAAFYNSASITPFPDMGIDFVRFLSDRFYFLTCRKLDPQAIMPVFVQHHYSPAFIVELLQVMVRDGFYDMESGLAHYYSLNPPDEEHRITWATLSALEKELTKFLVQNESAPLYSDETYRVIGEALGILIGQGAIQSALKRLRDKGILINAGRGIWEFENSGFKDYVSQISDE
jgi:hypothetical protein